MVTDDNFQINIAFLSLRINFVLANSADPDEMTHSAAFHLRLHCESTHLGVSSVYKGLMSILGSHSLTLCILMDSSFWFDTINLGKSIVHIEGCQVKIFKNYCILCSEDLFYLYKQCST